MNKRINLVLVIVSIIIMMLAILMFLYTQDINNHEYMFEIPNPSSEKTKLYNDVSKGIIILLGLTWFYYYCKAIVKGKL